MRPLQVWHEKSVSCVHVVTAPLLSHAHTHSYAHHTHTPTHTHMLYFYTLLLHTSLPFLLLPIPTHSHTLTPTHSHTLTPTHTHTHTPTHTYRQWGRCRDRLILRVLPQVVHPVRKQRVSQEVQQGKGRGHILLGNKEYLRR